MPDNFSDYISHERDRLNGERDQLFAQRAEIDKKLAEIEKEFQAIDAYEHAKTGRTSGRKAGPGRGRVSRRGSRRESIMEVIRQNPAGLSRGEILQNMGLRGDKSGEMSVSNALTALSKSNQVRREGGKYHVAV
jgi:hypothetical protein